MARNLFGEAKGSVHLTAELQVETPYAVSIMIVECCETEGITEPPPSGEEPIVDILISVCGREQSSSPSALVWRPTIAKN